MITVYSDSELGDNQSSKKNISINQDQSTIPSESNS